MPPRVLILRSPGTNSDQETGYAFELAGGVCDYVHVNVLLEHPQTIDQFQILCIPGGFSYGDDIAAGRILACQLAKKMTDCIEAFRQKGKLILGICNGFQVLIKSGFLFRADEQGLPATLTWNDHGRYIDCWVHLTVDSRQCVFFKGATKLYLPVGHAEGKFLTRNQAYLDYLQENNQLPLKYCRPDGSNGQVPYPYNPNGSVGHVAGVCDPTGRILGMMPHPERHIDPTHHPQWTRLGLAEKGDGLLIFENAVNYFV